MPFLAGVQSNVSNGVLFISSEYSVNSTSLHFSYITVNLLCLYINICLSLQQFRLFFFFSAGKPWALMKSMWHSPSCSLSKFIAFEGNSIPNHTCTYFEVPLVVKDPVLLFYSHVQWVKQPFPGELLDSCGLLYDLFILFCSYTPLQALPFHMFGEGFGLHLIVVLRCLVASSRR